MQFDVRLFELLDRRRRSCASTASARFIARRPSSVACASSRSSVTTRAESPRRLVVVRVGEPRFEVGEPALVLAVHALRHVLERAHRVGARLALEKAEKRELEQRDRRQESLGGARAEELARLVQHEDRAELSLVAQAARAEPARLAERRKLKEPRELVARLGEVDELAARFDRRALARRQVIERRVERGDVEVSPRRRAAARAACSARRRTG